MPLYETVVIARSEITQAQADAVADAVTAQLEIDGGAIKKRDDTHRMAEANKAFAHYRW